LRDAAQTLIYGGPQAGAVQTKVGAQSAVLAQEALQAAVPSQS
jgi:hypothetical protein